MTIAAEIIDRARDTLADPNEERWSRERLLRLLDEGQKSIARHFELLRDSFDVAVEVGEFKYSLPSNLWRINRVSTPNSVIEMLSYHEMDRHSANWATHTSSTIEAIVYDERNLHEIRVYPIPDENSSTESYLTDTDFGVTVSVDGVDASPAFGVISNASFELGYVASLSSPFGVLTDINSTTVLTFLYTKDPEDLTSLSQQLSIPQMYDSALKNYVIGHAFLDDLDTQYQNKGMLHIKMYEREVDKLGTKQRQYNGVRKGVLNSNSNYRGFE